MDYIYLRVVFNESEEPCSFLGFFWPSTLGCFDPLLSSALFREKAKKPQFFIKDELVHKHGTPSYACTSLCRAQTHQPSVASHELSELMKCISVSVLFTVAFNVMLYQLTLFWGSGSVSLKVCIIKIQLPPPPPKIFLGRHFTPEYLNLHTWFIFYWKQ